MRNGDETEQVAGDNSDLNLTFTFCFLPEKNGKEWLKMNVTSAGSRKALLRILLLGCFQLLKKQS